MQESKFLNTLDGYYTKGIPGTKFLCRFVAQATTFSFEIHDSNKDCFSNESLVHQSEVYSFWIGNEETQKKILSDIRTIAKGQDCKILYLSSKKNGYYHKKLN